MALSQVLSGARSEALQAAECAVVREGWQVVHEALSRLARCRAELDWEEGRWLLSGFREEVHRHLGFASFFEYVASLFGYKPRSIEEKLRVAEAIETLPKLGEALRGGRMSWSAVRELTRVATEETELAWCEAVRHMNIRQIEALVSGKKAGDGPEAPSDRKLRKHVLSFEVTAETLATYREAVAQLRRETGGALDEEAALLLMARQVLGGAKPERDEGRATYQIALTLCEACRRGVQHGRGGPLEVGADVVAMAACDSQSIGRVDGDRSINETHAHVGARSVSTAPNAQKTRATQTIPPRTRRLVLHRDGGQCVVPGCRHTVFVDVHHLALRSEGGAHDPDALVVLCAAHHRAVHRGRLLVEGRVSSGLVFRHADGSPYGTPVSAQTVAAQTRAFGALRRLGFREGEVRRALDRLRKECGFASPDSAAVVRAALQLLTQAATPEVGSRHAAQEAP